MCVLERERVCVCVCRDVGGARGHSPHMLKEGGYRFQIIVLEDNTNGQGIGNNLHVSVSGLALAMLTDRVFLVSGTHPFLLISSSPSPLFSCPEVYIFFNTQNILLVAHEILQRK